MMWFVFIGAVCFGLAALMLAVLSWQEETRLPWWAEPVPKSDGG